MKMLTKHQKDLVIDKIIRDSNPISISSLLRRARSIEPQISEANLRKRVEDDINRERAVLQSGDLVSFKLDRMTKRRLK
jgi:hypothetical protein